jgi:hypothetical protein
LGAVSAGTTRCPLATRKHAGFYDNRRLTREPFQNFSGRHTAIWNDWTHDKGRH